VTSAVSIVIPNWNGLELLKRFFPSVVAAAIRYSEEFRAPIEIIVVDDGSIDASVDWLLSRGFEEYGSGAAKRRQGEGAMTRRDWARRRRAERAKMQLCASKC